MLDALSTDMKAVSLNNHGTERIFSVNGQRMSQGMLFGIGIYIAYLVTINYSMMNDFQRKFGVTIIITFVTSICFWVFDKICVFDGTIHTHFVFHILVGVAGFGAIIFLDYVDSGKDSFDPIADII